MQAPLTGNGIKIPLNELLSILQKDGFEISTRTVLDIQKVLANLDDISKENTANLKLLLGPLICRNKEEQERFYKLFDTYEKQLNEHSEQLLNQFIKEEQTANEVQRKEEEEKKIREERKKRNNKRARIIITVFSIIVLGGAGYLIYKYSIGHRKHPTISFVTATTAAIPYSPDTAEARKIIKDYAGLDIIINKPKTFEVALYDTIANHKYDFLWQIGDSIYHHHNILNKVFYHPGNYRVKAFLLENHQKIDSTYEDAEVLCEPKPILFLLNDTLQQPEDKVKMYHARLLAAWHTKNYQFTWFVNDTQQTYTGLDFKYNKPAVRAVTIKVKAEGKVNPSCDTSVFEESITEYPQLELRVAGTQPLKLSREINDRFLKTFLMISLFGGIGIYSLFYEEKLKKLKAKFFTQESGTSTEKKQPADFSGPYNISFKPQEVKIAHESAISQLAETLRKRHTTDTYYLNINKTIRSSIRKAGFPVFEFTPRTQPTDFLIFVDKEYPDSHLVKLYNYVLDCLKNEQVNFTAYSYAHEPLLLSNEAINHLLLPIDKVARLYPGTILFLFADTETFFKPLDNRLQRWATEKFKSWDSKIIFTSVAKKDWEIREMILYNAGFTVVPADINAHKIIADEINHMIDRQRLKKAIVPDAYGTKHVNFNNWNALKNFLQDAVKENKNELHIETDSQLLKDWVCATAVYPYVNWDATIAIGKALEKKYGKEGELVNYTNLLLLGRIQWMKDGQMPDTLRIEMLKELSNDKEITARKAVTDLLEEIVGSVPEESAIFEEYQLQKITNSFLVRQYEEGNINWQDKDFMAVKEYLKNDRLDWATDIYLSDSKANTPVKQSKTDLKSIPIDKFIDVKEKEGQLKDEEKQKQFRQERRSLRWKTSGLISSIVIISLLSILYGFKIKPLVFPDKTDRVFNLKATDPLIDLNTDVIKISAGGTEYKVAKNETGGLLVKGFSTSDTVKAVMVLSTQNAITGNQTFSTPIGNGYKEYEISLGKPSERMNLRIVYSNEAEYLKIESQLKSILSDFNISASQSDFTSSNRAVVSKTEFSLEYGDTNFERRADSMKQQFKAIGNELQLNPGSYSGTAPTLYLIFPVPIEATCEEVSLPSGLSEIWNGGSGSNRLININLDKQVIYYSTGSKATYGTYPIHEVCSINDEEYRIITSANNQYKVFFIKDINRSAGFSLSVCQNLYPAIEEARKVVDANCDRFNTMSLYYENDPNKIFLPLSLNVLERRNQDKLNRIRDSLNYYQKIGAKIDISGILTYNSRFKWEVPDNVPVQIGQTVQMNNETPFDRTYIVYYIKVDRPEGIVAAPDCNRDFNSMREALGVDPKVVCRLNLKNQNLRALPDLRSFTNLNYIDVSGNYLGAKDSMGLFSMFPKARIIFSPQLAVQDESWKSLQRVTLNEKYYPENIFDRFFNLLLSELSSNRAAEVKITISDNENASQIRKSLEGYLTEHKYSEYLKLKRVIVELPTSIRSSPYSKQKLSTRRPTTRVIDPDKGSVQVFGKNISNSFFTRVNSSAQSN